MRNSSQLYSFSGWILMRGFAAGAFLLWLGPFSAKGGATEWIMFIFDTLAGVLVLAALWHGRMKTGLLALIWLRRPAKAA